MTDMQITVPATSTLLANLDQARQLVAQAKTIDEAKHLANTAEALRVYALKSRMSLDILNDCAEIRLRADRRVGELTRDLEKSAGRPLINSSRDGKNFKATALANAGLGRTDAARNEQIAALPSPVFEQHIAETKAARRELTKASVLEVAREHRTQERKAHPPQQSIPPPPAGVVLLQADARAMPIASESIHLTLTSPPYGLDVDYAERDVSSNDWLALIDGFLLEAWRVTAESGRLAINVPLDTTRGGHRPTYTETVQAALVVGWSYRFSITWLENNISKSIARGSVDSASAPNVIAPVEMIAVFCKGLWPRESATPSDLGHDEWLDWTNGLWRFNGESRGWEDHPAPFPEELPRRLVKLLSFPGDTILDPFAGSGTAVKVAQELGRRAIGLDIAYPYVESARRRLAGLFQ